MFSVLVTLVLGDRLAADDAASPDDVVSEATEASEATKESESPADVVGGAAKPSADDDKSSPSATDSEIKLVDPPTAEDLNPTPEVVAALQAGPRALSLAFRLAAKRATPSVVVIYSYGQDSDETEQEEQQTGENEDPLPLLERAEIPPPPPATEKLTGLGSGVIMSEDGLVITNNHVINNAKRVVVQLPDETRVDAQVVRGDPESDVAMLRVTSEQPLTPIAVGDSDKLEIGDWVLAIGSPFKLEATVSAGIISGKDRRLERIPRSSMLQTDAAINPGNSGGALIDLDGKVVGISTAIATRSGFYQGVGFAIPINQAQWIAQELDRHGEVRRAAIGTTLVELKPRIAKKFDLEPYSGILVYQVIKGSVAEKAGIQALDVIVGFAGERVRDSNSLQEAIERQPIGSKQPIVIQRGEKQIELMVELATVEDPTGGE
ncbi:trypsin-like serine protease [Roseiconus nitratireducens]|uniref:Trypsin-like serine protease n=2 Tax=Roseiconus nitratireducens TaxID=2605748 RepID=A0A5M6DLQ0_9BACT|nr:trypsin-like serine protease [Roseiconus nitratireducens]